MRVNTRVRIGTGNGLLALGVLRVSAQRAREESPVNIPNPATMARRGLVVLILLGWLGGAVPAHALTVADTAVLEPLFRTLLANPPVLRLDVVPDLYEGGYARVSVYAEHPEIKGMRIDQMWIRLVGVSFDPDALRQGTLKVLDVRESAIYGKLSLASVQEFLNHQDAVRNVTLTVDGDSITARGTFLYNGVPTRVRMQGEFQVYGAPEVFFHLQALFVNSIPLPYVVVDRLERQMNPVIDFRTWPVPFPVRSFHQSADAFVLSSQADYSQPCEACGGTPLQLKP